MLKSAGIIKRLDKLNRFTIPAELRNKFSIYENDLMEIFTEGDFIVLKKYEPNCIFCGATKKLVSCNNKLICTKCSESLKKLAEKSDF